MVHEVEGPGPGKPTEAGFYRAPPLGPFGGNLSLAGILLSGFFKLVREMLDKAQVGTAQFRKLQAVEREVAKLMKLLDSVGEDGKLPKDFTAQLNKIIGKGKNDPGVLGKLIGQIKDGPWDTGATSTRATLEAQLAGIRKSLGSGNVIARLQQMLKDLHALQKFLEEVRDSTRYSFFDANNGANQYKLADLLGAVYKDMNWLNAFVGEMGKVMKVPAALYELQGRCDVFWAQLMGVQAGLDWPWWSGTLGSLWGELFPSLKQAPADVKEHFGYWCDALLFNNGHFHWPTNWGWHADVDLRTLIDQFVVIERAISDIKPSTLDKISYGDYLKMVHMILQEEAKDPNWAHEHPELADMTQGYNQAMAELEKLLNTTATSQPDVNAYIKGASDQANQLLQTLRHFLTTFNRLLYSDIDHIEDRR